MTEAENIAVANLALEFVNNREFHRVAEVLLPTFVRHDLVGAYPEVSGANVTDFLASLIAGAPDLSIKSEDIIAAGDKVVVRGTLEGTHQGELFGQPPTGKPFSVNVINIYRFEDGKIAETWQLQDIAGFTRQIGA
ncbi:MAG: ester cyclase [Dehalococcoidia bacterium]